VLFKNINVNDGTGKPHFVADVRIHGDRIAAVASYIFRCASTMGSSKRRRRQSMWLACFMTNTDKVERRAAALTENE
jgi:hypothetical protein